MADYCFNKNNQFRGAFRCSLQDFAKFIGHPVSLLSIDLFRWQIFAVLWGTFFEFYSWCEKKHKSTWDKNDENILLTDNFNESQSSLYLSYFYGLNN